MDIIEVTKNRKEIMAAQNIYCPVCGERQFSVFDKLYTKAYDKCYMCDKDPEDELIRKSENIFSIINIS